MSVETEIKSLGQNIEKVGAVVEQVKTLEQTVADMQVEMKKYRYSNDVAGHQVSEGVKGMLAYIAAKPDTETKTAAVANPSTGGYFAVPEFINQVIPKLSEKSPLLPEITTIPVNASVISIPVEVREPGVNWVGEMQVRKETDVGLGMEYVSLNEMNTIVGLTNLLIATDNLLDAEAYLVSRVSDALSKGIGQAILMGDGNKKPLGLLADKRIKTFTSSIKGNDLVEKLFEVVGDAPSELVNPKWVMSSSTFWAIAKMFGKDSTYVNMPLSENVEARILGRPVVIVDGPAIANKATPIVYGDLKNGYYGVQSRGMSYIRDNLTAAERGMTKLIFSTYFGGQVVNPDCFRTITMGA